VDSEIVEVNKTRRLVDVGLRPAGEPRAGVSSFKKTSPFKTKQLIQGCPRPHMSFSLLSLRMPFRFPIVVARIGGQGTRPQMTTIGFVDLLQTLYLVHRSTISIVYHFRTHKVHAMLEVSLHQQGPTDS